MSYIDFNVKIQFVVYHIERLIITNENNTLEILLSRLLTVQSKLEEESNALDALIKIAYHYADNENTDLRSLLDAFKTRVDAIKNAVQAIE